MGIVSSKKIGDKADSFSFKKFLSNKLLGYSIGPNAFLVKFVILIQDK